MMMACSAADSLGPAHMVFLVGGAGNGKSRLAAEVVENVNGTRRGEVSAFAQRCYEFGLPNGRSLRVLNDATIPPADKHPTALLRDISEALRGKEHFLGCINRGVLIGEQFERASLTDKDEKVASDIVAWLLHGYLRGGDEDGPCLVAEAGQQGGNYQFAKVREAGKVVAVLHLVYMDSASLLEEWPAPPPLERTDAALPTVDLRMTPLSDAMRSSVATAFEPCLAKLAKNFHLELPSGSLDPIVANAVSLSSTIVARGWCSLMRGAEILSGTHFSFRELWALSAHSLVGPASSETMSRLAQHVSANLAQIQVPGINERVAGAVALGNLRSHMMLFEAGASRAERDVDTFEWPRTTSDALKAVHFADPVKHFGPLKGRESTDIDDALDRLKDGNLPGAELSSIDAAVDAYWGPLDSRIEEIVQEAIDPDKETGLALKDRSKLLSWYGRYLYRLVALVRGWPAHVSVVSAWQDAWLDACLAGRLDATLEDAILEIVAPVSEGSHKALFTFLQPRVTQGEPNAPKVRIEIPRNDMNLAARVDGDRVDIEIKLRSQRDDQASAVTSLDFHLLREAMAGLEGHGFTDSRLVIEPRIERLRAAMVAAQIRAGGERNRFNFSDRNYDETR
ncbi:hypothetical protein KUW09_24980 [Mameliella alba]|nr:hypothetical protein [Mameliella alba]